VLEVQVNGRTVTANKGEMLLDVLRREGIHIPTLCHVPDLSPTGACRLCVVELVNQNRLVPSCAFPVEAGMDIQTHSPRVLQARKTIVELLLSSHPDDCLYCVRNNKCELQSLAANLGVQSKRFIKKEHVSTLDVSSPSLIRDPDKCILCGRCVRVCEEIQGVSAIDFIGRGSNTEVGSAFGEGLNVTSCVNCGQCILACPTGALREQDAIKDVLSAIADPDRVVVVQHAPAVSVSLADELGMKSGSDICGAMTAAMRRLGFDYVFDTSFSADLTIMEEGSELVHRLTNDGVLPMMTSCSPGWIKFVEQFYPEFMDNLSTCKSPQQMMGAIIKTFFAEKAGIDPDKIFSVSVMPCTAKKFEAQRPEMAHNRRPDVDAVLTTRELASLIRMQGLDLTALQPEGADTPFGERSSAGKLFGATGGVMEAAIRSAYFLVTGNEMDKLEVKPVRGIEGVKEATVDVNGLELKVAVVNGLGNARWLLEEIKAGRREVHFIEVMTCPGGCIGGGGQPHGTDREAVVARMQALYQIDRSDTLRTSHQNPAIQRLYTEFLGEPLGHKSHELLHTHYDKRDVVL
jgi:iron-only hydrogenase group A